MLIGNGEIKEDDYVLYPYGK